MNASYVCLRCRLQIARRSSKVGTASFVSLGTLVNNKDSGPSPARELQRKKNVDPASLLPSEPFPQRPQSPRVSPQLHRAGIDNVLETLFASNQRSAPPPVVSRYSQTRADRSPEVTIPQDRLEATFGTLKQKFYTEQAPLEEVWELCLEILRAGSEEGISKDQTAKVPNSRAERAFQDILVAATRSRAKDVPSSSLPTPAQIIRAYKKHGLMRYWWDQILWAQLGVLVDIRYCSSLPSSDDDILPQAHGLIEDVLEVWKLFAEKYGVHATSHLHQNPMDGLSSDNSTSVATSMLRQSSSSGWRGLPSAPESISASQNFPVEAVDRLLYLLPRHPNNRQAIRTSAAAVMTVDCLNWLSENVDSGRSGLAGAEPFVEFVRCLGRESKTQRKVATKCLLDEGLPRSAFQKFLTGWGPVSMKGRELEQPRIVEQSNQEPSVNLRRLRNTTSMDKAAFESGLLENGSEALSAPSVISESEDGAWKQSLITSLSIDLHRAIDRSDTGIAIDLWQTFRAKLTSNKTNEHMREELFAQFLSAFFALRRPEQAVEVWNYMVRLGLNPTPKHWHAMMLGCTKSKDVVSMQQIWSNMFAAGVEPDTLLWTAWINGLIICRKWQLGLQALEELGRIWKSEAAKTLEQRSKNDASSPSITPIKAALRGLISINKPNIAQSVFTWAKSHHIALDTQTFNVLLRPAVRASNTTEVQSLLSQMHAHSCSPDVATFTIIINGLLSNPSSSFHSQSPAEQQAAVSEILADMEAAGLKANVYTYGTMLDGLLADEAPLKIPAARAVLDHMATNKVQPSPHIYTILITHYFSISPPDLSAIDGIWRRIKLEKAVVDPIFYDRMIENYARIGEIERMLFFLRRMPQEGKSPGWVALGAVLRELVKAEEWEMIKELVRDVADERDGLLRFGQGGWKGREEFWAMVEEVRGVVGIEDEKVG